MTDRLAVRLSRTSASPALLTAIQSREFEMIKGAVSKLTLSQSLWKIGDSA